MKHSTAVLSLLAIPLTLFASAAMAGKAGVTEDEGWSGNVLLGAGYVDIENSYLAGNSLIDVENTTIADYSGPQGESDSYPIITGAVNYTFGDGWQAFFGSDLQDLASLDTVQGLGIRKQFDSGGVFGVSLLTSGVLPAEVWQDPYDTDGARSDTDRESTGVQFDWYQILGSNFFAELSTREIELDDETSGSSVFVCGVDCMNQLRRDGDDSRLKVGYRWERGNSVWEPELTVGEDDRDGAAVSKDVQNVKLTHTYMGDMWSTVTSVAHLDHEYDALNPILGSTDADGYAASFSAKRKMDWGNGNWSLVGNVVISDLDSDADFNDATATGINIGANYAFGK
jgi:hypothetical protein